MMDPGKKHALSEKVKEMIIKTERKIQHLKSDTKPIKPENSIGRISRMDAIHNKSISEATLRKTKEKLAKLKMALLKLAQEDFGSCDYCGKEIAEARLMYMPESTRCIHCADK